MSRYLAVQLWEELEQKLAAAVGATGTSSDCSCTTVSFEQAPTKITSVSASRENNCDSPPIIVSDSQCSLAFLPFPCL